MPAARSRRTLLMVVVSTALAAVASVASVASLTRPGARAQAELVIFKEGTPVYHRPGCSAIRGTKGVLALSRGQAEARGLKAHPECDPARMPGGGRESAPPPAPVTVYVDGPKYYHRKGCEKLDVRSKNFKTMPLEAAAKSHWPCPACRPPIFKKSTEPAVPGTDRRRGG